MVIRSKTAYSIRNFTDIKAKLLSWASAKTPVAWLDSNDYPHQDKEFDAIVGVGMKDQNDFINTQQDLGKALNTDWLFGYFSYEYTSSWEKSSHTNPSFTEFPILQFFCPNKVWILKDDMLIALYPVELCSEKDFNNIISTVVIEEPIPLIELSSRTPRDLYLENASALKAHISRGDIYEVNYCVEWFASNVSVPTLSLYNKLNRIAVTPFAAYLKMGSTYLMCASPERFLKRQGTDVISQPIKGTAGRHIDPIIDRAEAKRLKNDRKERSENIMITDLIRNDLSRIAEKGSVKVPEQCAVYPFAQVHQMISTIKAKCSPEISSLDVVNACFPMGSMTGAPKQRAMELINQYEDCKRGLYSGAVGYFKPNGDFDFNVVIRSIVYDSQSQYLSTHVGSALTDAADPVKEYEECQLKIKAIKCVLSNKLTEIITHGAKV